MITRRLFLKYTGGTALSLFGFDRLTGIVKSLGPMLPGGTLDPFSIAKFTSPLLIPPAMPKAGKVRLRGGKNADYYEISMRQFAQQVLPAGNPKTTVWGYGPLSAKHKHGLLLHNAPSLTIETRCDTPVRIKWVNELVDSDGNYLPHLLPVDPTLHWANPPGGEAGRDSAPQFSETPDRYRGPVPNVAHLHGASAIGDESDGYAEAWFLPRANNVPAGYATEGTWYDFFKNKAASKGIVAPGTSEWEPGSTVCHYPNNIRASTAWYHDHTLGMTRLNVYAGPAGFFLIRGGDQGDGAVTDSRFGTAAVLPGPAPRENDKFPPNKKYFEVPIAIQDRSFNEDGSLFYPDSREFFDQIVGPFIPADHGFSPIWNPEFFGNTLIANGRTWPYMDVEQRRYRFRILNGCQSRFLILDFSNIPSVEVWQIGNEGGFIEAAVNLTADHGNRLLLGPAERADIIVDFTNVPLGSFVLGNVGPDEPFGGGEPGVEFEPADPQTTGQVLSFKVGLPTEPDPTTPPQFLVLPPIQHLPAETVTRSLALIEDMGMGFDGNGDAVEGPRAALLGVLESGMPVSKMWMDEVTENPQVGETEVWEFYNFTADAHPMHVHNVHFQILNRQNLALDDDSDAPILPVELVGDPIPPGSGDMGYKESVIAYPGQVTRVKMRFDTPGQFVWHCHIVEHEDNEMMRPFRIGPMQIGQPT